MSCEYKSKWLPCRERFAEVMYTTKPEDISNDNDSPSYPEEHTIHEVIINGVDRFNRLTYSEIKELEEQLD